MKPLASLARVCLGSALAAGVILPAAATPVGSGQVITPLIVAGAPPDTPAARVDPNVASSRYSGVVSINIRYDGQSFICSGALVSSRHIVTAGHCIDTDGNGSIIDISQPFGVSGRDVRVVFNATASGAGAAVVTASAVSMHPDYKGFGNCPVGVPGFCVNDDIAVVTLPTDAPAAAARYGILANTVGAGQESTLVGYGLSGDGWAGYTVGPNFRIKRSGGNILDLFEGDDEQFSGLDSNGFIQGGGVNEVWYADFDGTSSNGTVMNSACTFFGYCTAALANGVETNIGGGDSGGPSFIETGSGLALFANNTFGWSGFGEENDGAFGSMFGGIMINPYLGYLMDATGGAISLIPEPGSLLLVGLALLGATGRRRRTA